MVNVLIADDNVNYAISLMNYMNKINSNIKVCNIAKDGKETLKILNSKNSIDIILLDYKMPFYNGQEVLDKINDKNKYNNSVIVISGELDRIVRLHKNSMVYLVQYKSIGLEEIALKVEELSIQKDKEKKNNMLKEKITNEILYLGYDFSHKGTKYMIETINYISLNTDRSFESLEKDIYPIIAKKYNESVHNIKCRINSATTAMYYNCDSKELQEYFSFYTDTKPKVKTIINTILNKISKTN